MTNRNVCMRLTLMGICFAVSGCVSAKMILSPPTVPLAPEKADIDAKRFHPRPGLASIYVMREDVFTGQAALFLVSLDRNDKGKLSRGTYFLFTVPLGKHVITFTGNVDKKGAETIYAVEGGIYYLEI